MSAYRTEANINVDAHVGAQLKLRRILLGMSQMALGEAVGITFQQIQKYERGVDRVSASRLVQFAEALDVRVSFFFEGLDQLGASLVPEELGRREILELARAFDAVKSMKVRKMILELTKAVGVAYSSESIRS